MTGDHVHMLVEEASRGVQQWYELHGEPCCGGFFVESAHQHGSWTQESDGTWTIPTIPEGFFITGVAFCPFCGADVNRRRTELSQELQEAYGVTSREELDALKRR